MAADLSEILLISALWRARSQKFAFFISAGRKFHRISRRADKKSRISRRREKSYISINSHLITNVKHSIDRQLVLLSGSKRKT